MPLTVLIPALKPAAKLIEVVNALAAETQVSRIVVINDGSPPEYDEVFHSVAANPKAVVLRHAVNLGKGTALRTGMNHFLCNSAEDDALVTADADGQHLPEDIVAVGMKAQSSPKDLVLGSRAFSGDVPLRSRFGNSLTRRVFRYLIGRNITDTQTGLRAIPRGLMPRLLRRRASGYEFELEMLILAARARITITSVPIQTVYLDDNASSHFNPLLDSMRIYFIFARFLSSSLISSVLDFVIFALVLHLSGSLLAGMITARVISGTLNFLINKNFVFQSRAEWFWLIVKYVLMELVLGSTSLLAIRFLSFRAGWSPYLAKPLVEVLLFLGSYAVQRNLVFDMTPDDDDSGDDAETVA